MWADMHTATPMGAWVVCSELTGVCSSPHMSHRHPNAWAPVVSVVTCMRWFCGQYATPGSASVLVAVVSHHAANVPNTWVKQMGLPGRVGYFVRLDST